MKFKETLKDQRIIKIVITLVIILVLFKFINIPLLISSLKSVNQIFLAVLIMVPINILLRAWRLKVIINKDDNLITIKDSFYLNLAGITLNLFMPASSGDIAKSYYGYQWHGIKEEMLSANIFDKFMALFGIFFIGTITALILKIYILSIFSAVLSVFMSGLFFYPKIMPWGTISRFISKILKIELDEEKLHESFSVKHGIKLKTFLISVLASLVLFLQFYFICLSFNLNISFIYVLAIAPLLNLAWLFPLTINGLGTGEAMTIYLFSLINISPTMSILVSLMSQLVNAIIPGLFGFIIIMKK